MKTLRRRGFSASVAWVCLLPAAIAIAWAEDVDRALLDPDLGDPDVIPLSDAPGATVVITAEEIAASGAANIFDLLRTVPGVDVRYTPMGGKIGIRGTGVSPFTDQVLLLIDGTPYNSRDKGGFPGHPNYTGFFPLDRIQRIEIVKGPVSVVYGANAFGGVVNIVSKKPADALQDRVEGESYLARLVAGERGILERKFRFEMIRSGWEGTVDLSMDDGDAPVQFTGDAEHSRDAFYASVRRGNFRASLLHKDNRYGSFDFDGTPTVGSEHRVDVVDAHYETRLGEYLMQMNASVNEYRGTTCAHCHNPLGLEPDNARTTNVEPERETDRTAQANLRFDRVLSPEHDITFGFEMGRATVQRNVVRQPDVTDTLDNAGVYFQHHLRAMGDKLQLLTGVRVDYAQEHGSVVSPRIAFVGEPRSDLIWRASWARAYRTPTWNERFTYQRLLPGELAPGMILVLYGSPALSRERNDAAEAGVSWTSGGDVTVNLDLYYNELHDFIHRGPSQFIPGSPNELRLVFENRPDAFNIRGGELSVQARPFEDLGVGAGFAYRDVSLDPGDSDTAYAPERRVSFTATWSPGERWTVHAAGSHVSEYLGSLHAINPEPPQPSYELVDAAVRYRFRRARARWAVGVVGRNLLDEQPFETYLDGDLLTRLRGRTFVFEVSVGY